MATNRAESGIRVKGSTLRAYLSALTKEHRLDAVMARVPPETAEVLAHPPLASTWVDWIHVLDIIVAVDAIAGPAGVRELSRKMIDDAKRPHMRLLEGLLRLFEPSPATLFKRMNDLVKHTIENQEFEYQPISDRAGIMEMQYHTEHEVPHCMHIGATCLLEAIFRTCGVAGTVGDPERRAKNRIAYRVQW